LKKRSEERNSYSIPNSGLIVAPITSRSVGAEDTPTSDSSSGLGMIVGIDLDPKGALRVKSTPTTVFRAEESGVIGKLHVTLTSPT
jgi:hypothetical protein